MSNGEGRQAQGDQPHRRRVGCEGCSDHTGSQSRALKLTEARAAAVRAAVHREAKQVAAGPSVGYGGTQPVVVGGSKSQRVDNRRIVVVIDR